MSIILDNNMTIVSEMYLIFIIKLSMYNKCINGNSSATDYVIRIKGHEYKIYAHLT